MQAVPSVEEKKLALRRQQREAELRPAFCSNFSPARRLSTAFSVSPSKSILMAVVLSFRGTDGEHSTMHVREVLTNDERVRIQLFVDSDVAIAKARAFGIDVSQTLRNALLTREERWRRANEAIAQTRILFGAARRA